MTSFATSYKGAIVSIQLEIWVLGSYCSALLIITSLSVNVINKNLFIIPIIGFGEELLKATNTFIEIKC